MSFHEGSKWQEEQERRRASGSFIKTNTTQKTDKTYGNYADSRKYVPEEDLAKIEKCASVWNSEIYPHFYKGMLFGYLLAIGKLSSCHWTVLDNVASPKPAEQEKWKCPNCGTESITAEEYVEDDSSFPTSQGKEAASQIIEDAVFWNRRCVELTNEKASLQQQLSSCQQERDALQKRLDERTC